jgi:hypothetical protein
LGGRGAGNRMKEKVLLQPNGQLHGCAQGVLPRHKNAGYKRCVKESWLRKKKRKSWTVGLTVYAHDQAKANMAGKMVSQGGERQQ